MAEHGIIRIPDQEYKERVKKAAAILQRKGLDVLIVNSNEADYANARYFSGFWPLFERCGVAIAAKRGCGADGGAGIQRVRQGQKQARQALCPQGLPRGRGPGLSGAESGHIS